MKRLILLIVVAGFVSYYSVKSKTEVSELGKVVEIQKFKQHKEEISEVFEQYNQATKHLGEQETLDRIVGENSTGEDLEYGRQVDLNSIYDLDKIENQKELQSVKNRVVEILSANPDQISQVLDDFGGLTGELEHHVIDIINEIDLGQEHISDLSQFLFLSEIQFGVEDSDADYEVYFERLHWGLSLLTRKFEPKQYESLKSELLDFYQENARAASMVNNSL